MIRRILVLGSSGSGKTTFARRLGNQLGIEPIHLDSHYWLPNWQATPDDEWPGKLAELFSRDAWVMDGNYPSSIPTRLERAQAAVFLDLNRVACLARCLGRLARYRGTNRQELPAGCTEKLDRDFFRWIWRYPKDVKPRVLQMLVERAGEKRIVILRTGHEIDRFTSACRCQTRTLSPGSTAPSSGTRTRWNSILAECRPLANGAGPKDEG